VSSITWTPTEAASSAVPFRAAQWRAVEAQHRVATMPLVDTVAEQELLERALESSKPPVKHPAGMHWLLFTPFRYPPLETGSRFRTVDAPGVFYASDEIRTACAELGYWRWRFLMESAALGGIPAMPQTLFKVLIDCTAIDLRKVPFSKQRKVWTSRIDYAPCQQMARGAREAGIQAIRYESVRDPEKGGATAVLSMSAFGAKKPSEEQTWLLTVTRERAIWHRDSALHKESFEFDAKAF
jgi:RES domain